MNFNLDFVGRRKLFLIISAVILGVGILSLLLQGLNLGVDFVSGTRVDIKIYKPYSLEEAKDHLEEMGYKSPDARKAGENNERLIFRTSQVLSPDEVDDIEKTFRDAYGKQVRVNEQKVDPIIGRELARNAFISVLIASVGIILYVTLRFEYRFAIAAVLALFHDALFVIGIFSLFQWEVDLVFIAAVLTIVGYSVNDTIVIFDRIWESMSFDNPKTWEDLKQTVNGSLQRTLVRSLNTSLTVVFAALTLFIFGGESIRYFSLALLLGLLSGTYSSVFVASQIWVGWKWRSMQKSTLKAQSAE
ncbi:preprotein translocase subunit SecF [Melghirimyces algeriensis]|uniref:Protein-export membrane protein SecF n=1 Tax=Melghirimyces algeriensis TaxID=910412 RepID=A0A521AUV7_9BACL|nr:preprotein translocase subunit SecF [Melghirimyces algeriensis]